MSFKVSNALKTVRGRRGVDPALREYENRFGAAEDDARARDAIDGKRLHDIYYDLVTDFYEYGWGRSFHFAPRVPGESFKASLARHERNLADALDLRPGMVAADFGCGVGGPMLEIAQHSGAKIIGINSNGYQIEHARTFAEQAGLAHLTEFLHCDFLYVDAPDNSFDAAYDVEAMCHAPDKVSVYAEVFRVLKPGSRFAGYEYIMTDRYNPDDQHHVRVKEDIQLSGALLVIDCPETIDEALRTVGFEVLETRDLAVQSGPSVPWYQPLDGSGISFASFRSSRVGRVITTATLRAMEGLRLAPKGTVRVSETLNLCADAMIEAGRMGIFSPMYFVHARKPG